MGARRKKACIATTFGPQPLATSGPAAANARRNSAFQQKHKMRKRNRVKRARNRRKLNWKKLGVRLLWVAAIGAAIAGVFWMFTTPKLAVTNILIKQNRIVSADRIRKAARLAVGKNIFLLSNKMVRSAVLCIPEIERVDVSRRPPHTIIIRVRERQAMASLQSGGRFYEIDRTGFIFRRVPCPNPGLPLITLAKPIPLRPGCRGEHKSVRSAMKCLELCRKTGCKVTKLSVDSVGDLCLNIGSGFYVKLGQAEQIEEKLELVRTTLRARPDIGREALYIDVSCPSRPAWRPKNRV